MPYTLKTGRIKVKDSTTGEYGQFDTSSEPMIDAALSDTSENPVQNKAVKSALDQKANVSDLAGKASKTDAVIDNSISMGRVANSAVGPLSVALGSGVTASAAISSAFGGNCSATGVGAHAHGVANTASGDYSHAEGVSNTASGACSHTEGGVNTASGSYAHAEGNSNTAEGHNSHAEGCGNVAHGAYSHVYGTYAVTDPGTISTNVKGNWVTIVGNGSSDSHRSNAHTLNWNGTAEYAGDVLANACGGQNPVSLLTVASALNNKEYAHNYELIADVTLSESVAETHITRDSDNKYIQVKDALIQVDLTAANETSFLRVSFRDEHNVQKNFPTNENISSTEGMALYFTMRFGNNVITWGSLKHTEDTTPWYKMFFYNKIHQVEYMTAFDFVSYGELIPSGTRIRIYGTKI